MAASIFSWSKSKDKRKVLLLFLHTNEESRPFNQNFLDCLLNYTCVPFALVAKRANESTIRELVCMHSRKRFIAECPRNGISASAFESSRMPLDPPLHTNTDLLQSPPPSAFNIIYSVPIKGNRVWFRYTHGWYSGNIPSFRFLFYFCLLISSSPSTGSASVWRPFDGLLHRVF